MDGSRGYNAKWSQLVWERQIPYDFTHMKNLRNKTNKGKKRQPKNKILKYREQTAGCQRGGESEKYQHNSNWYFTCIWRPHCRPMLPSQSLGNWTQKLPRRPSVVVRQSRGLGFSWRALYSGTFVWHNLLDSRDSIFKGF